MLEIAQARAAIFLLDRDAVQSEFAHFGPQLAREAIGLVELCGDRRHLLCRKALHLVAQGIGGLAQAEVEGRHGIGDHGFLALSSFDLYLALILACVIPSEARDPCSAPAKGP